MEGRRDGIDGFAPRPAARPALRPRLLALSLVAILDLLLVLLLTVSLRAPDLVPQRARPVQIVLERRQPRPPVPPPMLRLMRPDKTEPEAPAIDIATPPAAAAQQVTAAPQGTMAMATGTGQSLRPAAAAPDPGCETMAAYTARIRSAIARLFDQSARLKDAHIQGTVTAHFLSDPQGRILDSAVATASVERLYPGYMVGGHYENLIIAFHQTAPDNWTWQARAHSDTGADVALADGSVRAGADGILRAPDRADGLVTLTTPRAFAVPQVTLAFGRAADLTLLEKAVRRTLDLAQPLPAIPACMKLTVLNAVMPFRFVLDEHPAR